MGVGDGVGVGVGDGDGVNIGVGDGVGVGVGDGVTVGVGEGDGVGEADGQGTVGTLTSKLPPRPLYFPALQTNFPFFFTQVYSYFLYTCTLPFFVQAAPVLTAEKAGWTKEVRSTAITKPAALFFIVA